MTLALVLVGGLLLGALVGLLAGQVQQAETAPADFKAPRASEGDAIPFMRGTCDIEDPIILWQGQARPVAVYVKGGKK